MSSFEPDTEVDADIVDDDTGERTSPLGVYGALQTAMFGPQAAEHQQRIADRARQLAEAEHGRQLALIELQAREQQRMHDHRDAMRGHQRRRAAGVAWQHMAIPVAVGAIGAEVAGLLAMFGWRVFG